MKSNQRLDLTTIPFPTTKHPIVPLLPNISNNSTHPSQAQKTPFLSKGWMEEEVLYCHPNTWMINIGNFKLFHRRAPQTPRILATPKKIIKVFLHLLTKQTTKKPYKEDPSPNKTINTVNPTKQDLLDK